MCYIKIHVQDVPELMIKEITNVPATLFEEHIQFIKYFEIFYESDDTDLYTFTLYTKDYKINLIKNTLIKYDTTKDESIEDKRRFIEINMYTIDFFKVTVQKSETTDIVNKRIYFLLDNHQFDSAECLDHINECREYNNSKNQQYQEMEKSLLKSGTDISKCKVQNDELRKLIESKNQDTSSNTIIIVCVVIIVLLLGLCIYLQFF